ncbi:uncharacterized protein RCC_02479 [Ramularia collo-cygni]|uniref:Extracellular membrane protein CFEM domain-containing protein n=1 Tax=Ramularia collo-cygni TaxID=112498 RepID=A0A2D3V2C9_9PEZI|nr:uncharacterized protein RCC_02479 [Ramularia collo-cygni]CZT16644.1 uncharacterized protein RCC_02479 [Ramularia collo-cygni]
MPSRKFSRQSSTTVPTLPQELQSVVPSCAHSCLSTYISQGYEDTSACSNGDLSCLCSSYSSYGLTLGELGLICLQTSGCGPASRQEEEQQAVFGICSGQSNAAQATHTVLSPPATTQSSSTRTISTESPSATTTSASIQPNVGHSTQQPKSTSSSVAASSSSSSDASTNGLTSAQVIGISIAAVGFVVLAIAFAYIMACVRRRRKSSEPEDLKHWDGFADDKTPHKSWFTFPDSRHHHDTAEAPQEIPTYETGGEPWQSQHYESREKATAPRKSMSRDSLRSSSSIRTVSRLLPEKPSRIHPQPQRTLAEPVTVQTPATIFEEDRCSIVQRPIPSLPKNPRQPQYAHQFTKPPEAALQPSLSLEIPRQATRSGAIEAVTKFPNPRENTFASTSRPFYETPQAASSTNSFLNYYEGPDSGSPEDFYPYTPIDEHSQVRRAAPAAIVITKPTFPPVAVRTSMASDMSRRTSFESTDPDEPTPPGEADEGDKRLTPVAESPIASIRYPKIPRGSNQTVPRSPPQPQYRHKDQLWPAPIVVQRRNHGDNDPVTPADRRMNAHSPSLSGSTLAAKRVGHHAAHSLEKGLRITPSGTPPQDRRQPPRGYGNGARNQSPGNWPLPSQEPLKSPLWEPKLTPRRMGGDLYLSVSVATPKNAHFFER